MPHFGVEKNRPATLEYPILSAFGDLWMYVKIWQGTMDAEVARGVQLQLEVQSERG